MAKLGIGHLMMGLFATVTEKRKQSGAGDVELGRVLRQRPPERPPRPR